MVPHLTLQQQSVSAKNIQANLQSNIKILNKKVDDMTNNHRMEMELLRKNTEGAMREKVAKARREVEAANQENIAKTTEIEALKSQSVTKDEEIAKEKGTVTQLTKIGRKFREQKAEAEKKVAALEEEKKKLEEDLAKKVNEEPSGIVSPAQDENETHKLHEEGMKQISALEAETDKLKAENEELQKTISLKEERWKMVLKTAREKIQKFEEEKKKLEQELKQIGEFNKILWIIIHYFFVFQVRRMPNSRPT